MPTYEVGVSAGWLWERQRPPRGLCPVERLQLVNHHKQGPEVGQGVMYDSKYIPIGGSYRELN